MNGPLDCPFCGKRPTHWYVEEGQPYVVCDNHAEPIKMRLSEWNTRLVGDKRRSASVDAAVLAQSIGPPFAGWRWRIRGHWRGPGWVMTERLPEFTDDADVEIERLCVAPVDARPQPVGEIQRQFYVWWEGHQKDPSHGMITQNCALATWHGAYDLYVRGHHSLWSHHAGCLLCGRPIGEHSMNTADICNTFIGGSK